MEMDPNINDILCEIITFLEHLRDVQLPLALESLREKLLEQSKSTLNATKRVSSSPEPYLDMNSGPKTILLTKNEDNTEEYVGMEEPPQQQNHQDYETFEHDSQLEMMTPITAECAEKTQDEQDNEESNQEFINIYKSLSAAQSKSKCHKCGPLHRKDSRKLLGIVSELYRACWIALMGSHMLIYRSERHTRPDIIYPIRGYMARPVSNPLIRDRQKSESVFEIYCSGNETLQFIARTPKDMHQWVAKVCEIGCGNKSTKDYWNTNNPSSEASEPLNHRENNATSPRRHKTGKSADNVKKKSSVKRNEAKSNKNEGGKDMVENPPPLPTRIPRRLPSIPSKDSMPSYKAIEDYNDNDDIYYKIDDLKMTYQNVTLAKKQCVNVSDNEYGEAAGYDDVRDKGGKEGQTREEKSNAVSVEEELYDDIFELSRNKPSTEEEKTRDGDRPIAVDDEEESIYDDVENLLRKSTKDREGNPSKTVKDQTETSSKFLQKKSFLERVWNRKESPGKTEKKSRSKISSNLTPSSSTVEKMPTYDDVSDLMSHSKSLTHNEEEELPEYNCPPPPRLVYMPSIGHSAEELYDDISTCREQYNKNHQQTILQSTQESCASAKEAKNDTTETKTNGELLEEEIEHYQSPRSDLCVRDTPEYQNEELYDDIALSVKFKARQRDFNEKKVSEDGKSTIGFDKKSWNRFTMNRNRRSGEPACFAEANKRNTDDSEEIDDSVEDGISKRNTFQKLINKMENSLAKVSVRGPTSLPMNKPNTASNNS